MDVSIVVRSADSGTPFSTSVRDGSPRAVSPGGTTVRNRGAKVSSSPFARPGSGSRCQAPVRTSPFWTAEATLPAWASDRKRA